jgi:hypothetical protein
MEKIDYYKKIEIPHLHATLYVLDMSKLKGTEIKGAGFSSRGEEIERHCNYLLFFQNIKESVEIPENYPLFAHEVMHILTFLCEDYNMEIKEEHEHLAYLMTYLLEEIISPTQSIGEVEGGK